jgi:hypothetical protein
VPAPPPSASGASVTSRRSPLVDAEEKRANRARADPGEAETGGEARSHEAYGFTEHERADMRAAPA